MKYGLLFLFAAIIGTKVSAVDFSYSAVTTPYKWSTSGNWSSGGFPGQNDSVSISQPLFLQTPLHVDQNVMVSNLFLDVGTLYVDEGKSLTAKKNNSGVVNLGQSEGAVAVLTNKGAITTYTFDLGTYNRPKGTLARVDNFGSITIANHLRMGVAGTPSVFYNHEGATVTKTGGNNYTFYFGVGAGGHTRLVNEGVFLDSSSEIRMGLQSHQNASCELVLNKSGYLYAKNTLSVGDGAWSSPQVELNDSSCLAVAGKVNIGGGNSGGANTYGTVTLNDASSMIASNDIIVARNKNSNGKMYLNGNSRVRQEKGSLIIANGESSKGSVYIGEGTELWATNIVVAANTTSANGLLEVAGTITNLTRIKVGCNSATSFAQLKLKGGKLSFNGKHIDPLWLNERRTQVSGVVRGWGTVELENPRRFITDWQLHKSETGYSRPMTLVHYGQVVADGGVLDFGRFGALSHRTTEANPSGTNGWLAVNQGVLRLPRCLALGDSGKICIGDCFDLDYSQEFSDSVRSNRLANTFSCAFAGNVGGAYVFSELYAADHPDIPHGVSQFAGTGGRVLAVWRIGCFSDGPEAKEPSVPVAFDSAKIHFRHMNDNLDGMVRTYVCRHDGAENGQWRLAGRTKTRKGWPVVSASVNAPSPKKWNLGWFAVIAREKPFGAFIVVR